MEYVYLVRKELAVKENHPVYKVGRTSGNPSNRINSYGDCEIIILHNVRDAKMVEKIIKERFRKRFQNVKTFGNPTEDFAGDIDVMKKIFTEILMQYVCSPPAGS